jgi:hypothetical protein
MDFGGFAMVYGAELYLRRVLALRWRSDYRSWAISLVVVVWLLLLNDCSCPGTVLQTVSGV